MSIDENSNKPKRPFGRALKDFKKLSWAEKKLIACTTRGKLCVLGLNVPDESTRHNSIRPDLIRFLALGGDETAPVHEKGVQLRGAWIGSAALDFGEASLASSLWLFNCHFSSPLTFRDARARSLYLDGSVFPGISADRLKLDGGLFLRRVHSKGTVRLLAAEIGGNLDCSGGHFENEDDMALLCDGARIGGEVIFSEYVSGSEKTHRFHAKGGVHFVGAKIGGSLNCNGGRFENEGRRALSCDGAKIDGCVFLGMNCDRTKKLRRRFHAIGEVCFVGASIGASLLCSGGLFENKFSDAISGDSARIGGSVLCREGFRAIGAVRFPNIIVDGDLDCRGGRFKNDVDHALLCDGAEIGGGLFFRDNIQAKGFISLAHAKVGTLADNINFWPDKSLVLDGFRYERIDANSPLDAKSRISWLDKQKPEFLTGDNFALQPWIQLAKVLREQGHFREAAEVDVAREDRLRVAGKVAGFYTFLKRIHQWVIPFLSMISRISKPFISAGRLANDLITYFFHWVYGWFSGYGHRPLRIIYFAAAIWVVFAFAYNHEASNGHFAPTIPLTDKSLGMKCVIEQGKEPVNWTRCNELLVNYPRFNAWAYSLDLILPVVQLGEFTRWTHVWRGDWLSFSGLVQILIYFEKIFGWVAALTLAAIATGLVKRKDG